MTKSKTCTKCGKTLPANKRNFNIAKKGKYGLSARCKECMKLYYSERREIIQEKRKQYNLENKDKMRQYFKERYQRDKEKIKKQTHNYKIAWREKNKELISEYGKKYKAMSVLYTTTKIQELSKYEVIRNTQNGLAEIQCAYCGRWIVPTIGQVDMRLGAINGTASGENRIYCNDNNDSCKLACPTFHRLLKPKDFKKATSREVNPLVRQMCFQRDNYECQKCGITIKESQLHCHHIEGAAQNPLISNDITNVITVCKQCHKTIHKKTGCTYQELKCKQSEMNLNQK